MKSYLIGIVLVLLSIGGIGGYYTYAALDELPEYRLVAIEGDASFGERIELSGSYGGRMRSQHLDVTTEGSQYSRSQSFIESEFIGARDSFLRHGVGELIREHREFMRGKGSIDSLFKDDEWLIYAEPVRSASHSLSIERLELASGQMERFEVQLPEQEDLSYLDVTDVQRLGNEVYVVTTYQHSGERGWRPAIDYFVNVVDLASGAFIRQEKLDFRLAQGSNIAVQISVETEPTFGPGDAILFIVAEDRWVTNEEVQALSRRLYSYSFADSSLAEWKVGQLGEVFPNGDRISMLFRSGDRKTIKMNHYDLETKEAAGSVSIHVDDFGGDQLSSIQLKDGNIYALLLHPDGIPEAIVVNADNSNILYRGKVVYTGNAGEAAAMMEELTLNNLNIRD